MGRRTLPHGSQTYPAVANARSHYETVKRQAEAEAKDIVRAKIDAAHDELVVSVRSAYNTGASISKLCEAYGTKDRRTIYSLLDPATRRTYDFGGSSRTLPDVYVVADWKALVMVHGGRVEARHVPPTTWTFERGTDRPADIWSGWIDVRDGMVVDSSEYPGPLQAEWLYGDGTLREVVGL